MPTRLPITHPVPRELTYQIIEYSKKMDHKTQDEGVRRGLDLWEDVAQVKFTKVNGNAHVRIAFQKTMEYFFRHPNVAAAHVTGQGIVFNDDISFGLKDCEETMTNRFGFVQRHKIHNMIPIVAHEFGHLMNLDHTINKEDIMHSPRIYASKPSQHDIEKMNYNLRAGVIDVCDVRIKGFLVRGDKLTPSGINALNNIDSHLFQLESSLHLQSVPIERQVYDPHVYELHQVVELVSMTYPEHATFLQLLISLLYQVTIRNQILKSPETAPRPGTMNDEKNFHDTVISLKKFSSRKTDQNSQKEDFIRCCNMVWKHIDKIVKQNIKINPMAVTS